MAANRTFGREHNGIRPIQNCIGYIGNFRTGRLWLGHHRLHHLRCCDDDRVLDAGFTDETLLHSGYFGVADLNTQIPAGHHDDI